jgi:hypothetical protein
MAWDTFCCICGNSFFNFNIEQSFLERFVVTNFDKNNRKKLTKITKWIKNPITLLTNNQVYKNYFQEA